MRVLAILGRSTMTPSLGLASRERVHSLCAASQDPGADSSRRGVRVSLFGRSSAHTGSELQQQSGCEYAGYLGLERQGIGKSLSPGMQCAYTACQDPRADVNSSRRSSSQHAVRQPLAKLHVPTGSTSPPGPHVCWGAQANTSSAILYRTCRHRSWACEFPFWPRDDEGSLPLYSFVP